MSAPFDPQDAFDSSNTEPDVRKAAAVPAQRPRSRVGRYAIVQLVGSDAMTSVYLARMFTPAGEPRPVAIKHLHPQLARDADFSTVFIDQATLASCIRHRNVLP